MSNTQTTSSGIGFPGLLAIVFITLKLCGVITWPWLWVLAPLWIGLALAAVFIGALLAFAGVCFLIAAVVKK